MARKKGLENKEDSTPTSLCWRCNKYKGKGDWFCNCWRPSVYKEEYAKDIVDYFQWVKWEIYYNIKHFKPSKLQVEKHYDLLWGKGEREEEWPQLDWWVKEVDPKIIQYTLPTIERWASNNDVSVASIYRREEKIEEFWEALAKCRQIQKAMLIELWLSNIYNSAIVKLMLSANHGMKETNTTELTWKDWWPVNVVSMSDEELLKLIQWK